MPGRDTTKTKDRLEDLTLYEQIQVATHPESYGKIFTKTLGGSRQIACSVLGQLSEIRNKVFHFRDELTLEELDSVLAARVWLHRKMAIAS
ncbi:hypothetical protein [Actinoplanes friuliensis]|uniref:DUF4145 domain-containing protein n=1 Tax=Actinoplanes friuliensis DSM 7358 TaxID=1246995 RepID=U5W899_9ACTN|nr:hypothetical protein [Actinoplanes friuliensis]AGZ44200.1 hypothetical protein AFR_29695 [Actinoplanes friuliensis DSM 7358]